METLVNGHINGTRKDLHLVYLQTETDIIRLSPTRCNLLIGGGVSSLGKISLQNGRLFTLLNIVLRTEPGIIVESDRHQSIYALVGSRKSKNHRIHRHAGYSSRRPGRAACFQAWGMMKLFGAGLGVVIADHRCAFGCENTNMPLLTAMMLRPDWLFNGGDVRRGSWAGHQGREQCDTDTL